MPPITICPLHDLSLDLLQRICGGYTSSIRYTVTHHDKGDSAAFSLQRESLAEPYVKMFTYDEATLANYRSILGQGFSFGAYSGGDCVGVLVGDMHDWNRSLWIWEFHVAPGWQGQGIGRQLMAAAEQAARAAGLRVMVCETQSTNGAAVDAYRRLGFRVEGVDISYYSNEDVPDGECAVFMKKRLA